MCRHKHILCISIVQNSIGPVIARNPSQVKKKKNQLSTTINSAVTNADDARRIADVILDALSARKNISAGSPPQPPHCFTAFWPFLRRPDELPTSAGEAVVVFLVSQEHRRILQQYRCSGNAIFCDADIILQGFLIYYIIEPYPPTGHGRGQP